MSRRKRYTRNFGRKLKSPLPVETTQVWIRFEHKDEPYGLFSYIRDACARLEPHLLAEVEELRNWFADHLDAPDLLTIERFWFRAEAATHIAQAHRLATILRSAGIPIVERRTRRVPGRVRFSDDHQVAVLMYRDAPGPSR